MKTKVNDLSKTLRGYSSKWLALKPSSMKVVAAGRELSDVMVKARRMGVDNPILTRAPKNYGAYIL